MIVRFVISILLLGVIATLGYYVYQQSSSNASTSASGTTPTNPKKNPLSDPVETLFSVSKLRYDPEFIASDHVHTTCTSGNCSVQTTPNVDFATCKAMCKQQSRDPKFKHQPCLWYRYHDTTQACDIASAVDTRYTEYQPATTQTLHTVSDKTKPKSKSNSNAKDASSEIRKGQRTGILKSKFDDVTQKQDRGSEFAAFPQTHLECRQASCSTNQKTASSIPYVDDCVASCASAPDCMAVEWDAGDTGDTGDVKSSKCTQYSNLTPLNFTLRDSKHSENSENSENLKHASVFFKQPTPFSNRRLQQQLEWV